MEDVVSGAGSMLMGSLAKTKSVKKPVASSIPSISSSESDTDELLLIAVGNHQDRAAFNALFSRFSNKIYAMGMKLTRNEQLSHDLVQEAMLTVWQKAPLYDLDR